jgi:hypothetical protein
LRPDGVVGSDDGATCGEPGCVLLPLARPAPPPGGPKGPSDEGGREELVEFCARRSACSIASACSRQVSRELAVDVAALNSDSPGLQRFAKAAAGLVTYIDNNAIPDYSERRRYAEPISTAFTDVNLVVGKRFAKKQQMQWSKAGAHLLLQTRTQTLDGTLWETFRKWYAAMAANDAQMPAVAA